MSAIINMGRYCITNIFLHFVVICYEYYKKKTLLQNMNLCKQNIFLDSAICCLLLTKFANAKLISQIKKIKMK